MAPVLKANAPPELVRRIAALQQSQWWPAERHLAAQLIAFGALARHAHRNSSDFARRLDGAGLDPAQDWTPASFRRIPLLSRAELVTLPAAELDCRLVPAEHGEVSAYQSSGSTGQPVTVRRTRLNSLVWMALTVRDHQWHQRDLGAPLAVVRPQMPVIDGLAARQQGWGPPVTLLFETGPGYARPLSTPVREQADWLLACQPAYLLTFPTNLAALLDRFRELGARPAGLRQLRTVGETVTPELRRRCEQELEAPLTDIYSSQEMGTVAIQCPAGPHYHVQAENVLAEVLDDEGRPCEPGQTGRIVITDLHNYATPLVRYDVRDYATVGLPCPCGRGLPTWSRVLGRRRNMFVTAAGDRIWPLVGVYAFRRIADIRQYQLVQHAIDEVEVRLVVGGEVGPAQEAELAQAIHAGLGHAVPLRFTYWKDELPRSQGGKFEEFISLVP